MSRKRQRPQPDRPGNRALKIVLIAGCACLVLLFAGLVAVKAGIERYRNSEAFRERIRGKVAATLRSQTGLESLRWDGATALADGFRARGYEDASLSSLEMDGLRATLDGTRDGAWQIVDAKVSRLGIEFSRERLPGTYAATLAVPESDTVDSGPSAPAWLRRFLPDRFDIDTIEADAATLRVLDGSKAETFALRSVKTAFQPHDDGGWVIEGRGGKFAVIGQPEMGIDRFRVRWQDERVFLNEAELTLTGKARASLSGTVTLNESTDLELDIDLANLDADDLLPPGEWRDRLSGIVRGTVKVTGPARQAETLRQKGTLHLDGGEIQNVPILKTIADYTKNRRFERLTLNEASAEFERQGDRIEVSKLTLQSDGLARLEGTLSVSGRNLTGHFKLGVTPGTLGWIPGAERKVFSESREGFLWTDVKLSGTLDEPREDLSARLVVAAAETLVQESPEKAIEAVKEAIKNPTATPGTVTDEAKKLLDVLGPLFKK